MHSRQLEKQVGLTLPQILVLQTIEESGRVSVSEIARQVSLSQATVTSVIDRLVKKDLVYRERSTTDRRKVRVILTESAKEKLREMPELLQQDFISQFDKLEGWEQKMLIASVERIASLMGAEDVDASPILQVEEILPGQPAKDKAD